VAVAHAGRRGVQAGVVPAAVAATARLGAGAASLRAYVGPAVCGSCYEVPPEMQAELVAVEPTARATTRRGTAGLDLRAAVRAQLAACGVGEVEVDPACTAETPALFSHRRDRVTGRLAAVVQVTP
jgi:hypothetical protein